MASSTPSPVNNRSPSPKHFTFSTTDSISTSSPLPTFSPVSFASNFTFENGGHEGMKKDGLKTVENFVFERYIRELKGEVGCWLM